MNMSEDEEQRLGVLIVHPANVFGGAERTLINLLTHLDRTRFRVVLVAMPKVLGHAPVDGFYGLTESGVADGFRSMYRAWKDARALVAIARRERCSVMLGMLHYGAILAPLCRLASFGQVRAVASPRTPSTDGIRFHVGVRGRQARLWRMLVAFFCRFSNRVLVASEGLRHECVTVFGASPWRVDVVPNSVDDEVLERARQTCVTVRAQTTEGRPWLITTSGRLAPEKDLPTLIRAFSILRRSVPARLELLGEGPERSVLEALAASLGVAGDVSFTGFVSRPMERVAQSDLFVHTALFEGFGNVLLEAMACGVPLVATDCDFGPREIVRDGVNGRLVPVCAPERLAAVILELLLDAGARSRLAAQALVDIEEFSAHRMALGYEKTLLKAYME